MYLTKAASVVSFLAAFVLGVAAVYFVSFLIEPVDVAALLDVPAPSQETSCHFARFRSVPVQAEDLRGRWTGTWAYDGEQYPYDVEFDIDRVDGNKFYGTLRQEGAEIAFVGTVDADARSIYFRETKVIKLGAFSQWSLGRNFGSFSTDGQTLNGRGKDEWAPFGWKVQKQ
jgi:hypothetical protein